MLILGGSIDGQLGKDLQGGARITSDNVDPLGGDQSTVNLERICESQSMVNLERICKDIARITSDSVNPGGVDRWSTWKESAKTLQGSTLTMLILGQVN